RCMVRLIGWTVPRPGSRPGRVTSIDSPARRASSSASSSSARRAASARVTASRTRLIASPAALRSSAGRVPSALSRAVMLPPLPSSATRSPSSASALVAAAMSCIACFDSDSMSLIERPLPSGPRPGWRPVPATAPPAAGPDPVPVPAPTALENRNGDRLAPVPMRVPPGRPTAGRAGAAAAPGHVTLRRERALRLLGQGREPGRVVHGDVRQHLAVQGDAGLGQPVHETAVAQPVGAGGGIDARDPQAAEIALLLLAVDVGVLLGLDDRLLGDAEDLAPGVVVALGTGEDLLVATTRLHATLDSCHGSALLRDTAACGPDGLRPRRGRGSSAGGCA